MIRSIDITNPIVVANGKAAPQGEEFSMELAGQETAAQELTGQDLAGLAAMAPDAMPVDYSSSLASSLVADSLVTGSPVSGSQAKAVKAELAETGARLAQVEAVEPGAFSPGKSALHSSTISKSELAHKSAAGMKTAAAIAGLKPWSREWVFEGFENPRPELKPLFSSEEAVPERPAELLRGLLNSQATGSDAAGSTLLALQGKIQGADAADLELVRLDGVGAKGKPRAEGEQAGRGLSSQLSGAEFLTALNSTRSVEAKGGASSQLFGDSPESGMQLSQGLRPELKPELKLVRGESRGMEGSEARGFAEVLAGPSLQQSDAGASHVLSPKVVELTGQTAKGAMAQDRLSTDALIGVSGSIRDLGANGGGEIRIRLRPENLGELHLRVVTRGTEVGLHIRASDDRAMKVIEQSMSFLKDSLASQNLNLAKVELAVAPSQGSQGSQTSDNGTGNQGHHGFQDLANMMGQEKGQGNREHFSDGSSNGRDGRTQDGIQSQTAGYHRVHGAHALRMERAQAAAANGRIDVTA